MRAVVVSATGGPERLELREAPEPEGTVVEVRAAGVNFFDVLVRSGRYPQQPQLPYVPGAEVAGDLGGRRVLALTRNGGGYAERAAVDERWVLPLPDSASYAEGASFLTTFLTAWIPLTRPRRELAGATVLVHAAAGGVGSAAVQLARHLGARVVGTAGNEEKRRLVRELGAEEAFGYDELPDDLRAELVLDPVGGETLDRSLRLLAPLGTVVAIGYAGGPWRPVDPALLVGRNAGLQGFYLGRLLRLAPELVHEAAGELLELWRQGAVRPLVGAEYPLARAADAHRQIEERRSVGKVVLVP